VNFFRKGNRFFSALIYLAFLTLVCNTAFANNLLFSVFWLRVKVKTGNRCTGSGTWVYLSGSKYIGEWKNFRMNGNGKFFYNFWPYKGFIYEGSFRNNYLYGEGNLYFGSGRWKGSVYKGGFRYNKFYGSGELIYKNGDRYTGDFQKNRFNGKGLEVNLKEIFVIINCMGVVQCII